MHICKDVQDVYIEESLRPKIAIFNSNVILTFMQRYAIIFSVSHH